MKLKFLLFGLLVHFQWAQSQNQQAPFISSGYKISSMLCATGTVSVWGQGALGTGGSAALVPTNVPFPAGVNIKQVATGDGHFLAVDCMGNVWAWGDNSYGQCGIASYSQTVVNSPTKVKAGAGPADADGNLTNVVAVTGGIFNSYALLSDSRIVAWGINSQGPNNFDYSGTLGNNKTVDSYLPVLVLDGTKPSGNTFLPLINVTQVQSTGGAGIALTSNGMVYSWGNTNTSFYTLGRALNGGTYSPGSGNTPGISAFARPVTFPNNVPLSNIVSISGGDALCLALSADGYVWAWGNGYWGGCTGQTTPISNLDPRRVVKGLSTGAGTDGQFLLAKSIAAGQGFGMAVTLDGKPMAWGNNNALGTNASGGNLGDGTNSQYSYTPVYIVNSSTNGVDNDVVSISKGALNGFYTRSNNSIFTWGNNTYGQLGLGNTLDQHKATIFNAYCPTPDPIPYTFITHADTILCARLLEEISGFTIDTRFNVSSNPTNYQVTWTKSGRPLPTGNLTASEKYTVKDTGLYIVSIQYIGNYKVSCQTYPTAKDTFLVKGYPADFYIPGPSQYCTFPVSVHAQGTNFSPGVYSWYASAGSSHPIGTTKGKSTLALASSDVTIDANGTFLVYVEEIRSASGYVGLLNNSSLCGGTGTPLAVNSAQEDIILQVYEDIYIDSIDVYQQEPIASSDTIKWQAAVYGAKIYNGGWVKDNLLLYRVGPTLKTSSPNITTLRRIPVNVSLNGSPQGTVYAFSLKAGGTVLDYSTCTPSHSYPYSDNLFNEQAVDWISYDRNGNPALNNTYGHYMFNMQFSVAEKFCNRIPATFAQNCVVTGDATNKLGENELGMVSPNPFKESIKVNTEGVTKLAVDTTQGQWVEDVQVANTSHVFIGQQWKLGMYVLQLSTPSSVISRKVVKE